MIKDEGSAHAYQWSSAEGRWVKIGAIVGGSGGSQGASGKQLYEGQVRATSEASASATVLIIHR